LSSTQAGVIRRIFVKLLLTAGCACFRPWVCFFGTIHLRLGNFYLHKEKWAATVQPIQTVNKVKISQKKHFPMALLNYDRQLNVQNECTRYFNAKPQMKCTAVKEVEQNRL